MNTSETPLRVDTVEDAGRAATLLHPLRLQILKHFRNKASASSVAAILGLPRQRVNYHVRALREAGFLRPVGEEWRRNVRERFYVATANAYQIAPVSLGPVAADDEVIADAFSSAYLLALAGRVQTEVGRAQRVAARAGQPLSTLSVNAEFRFESAAQRARFARALQEAVLSVISEHSSASTSPDGRAAPGRPYRLVVGCYPVPPEAAHASEDTASDLPDAAPEPVQSTEPGGATHARPSAGGAPETAADPSIDAVTDRWGENAGFDVADFERPA